MLSVRRRFYGDKSTGYTLQVCRYHMENVLVCQIFLSPYSNQSQSNTQQQYVNINGNHSVAENHFLHLMSSMCNLQIVCVLVCLHYYIMGIYLQTSLIVPLVNCSV